VAYINTADTYAPNKLLNPRFDVLKRIFPDLDLAFTIHNEETVTEGIRDLCVQHDVDLVAMMTHGRTGLSHFVRGSIAEDVSATVKTPLLALKKGF
jgi:nucleotide-binding universal stress UspA family protein